MPSSSTGCALIDGTEVSISGVCVATAGEVLCGKVVDRDTGDTRGSLGGKIGGAAGMGLAIVMIVVQAELVCWCLHLKLLYILKTERLQVTPHAARERADCFVSCRDAHNVHESQ